MLPEDHVKVLLGGNKVSGVIILQLRHFLVSKFSFNDCAVLWALDTHDPDLVDMGRELANWLERRESQMVYSAVDVVWTLASWITRYIARCSVHLWKMPEESDDPQSGLAVAVQALDFCSTVLFLVYLEHLTYVVMQFAGYRPDWKVLDCPQQRPIQRQTCMTHPALSLTVSCCNTDARADRCTSIPRWELYGSGAGGPKQKFFSTRSRHKNWTEELCTSAVSRKMFLN